MPSRRYMKEISSAALLATKRSAGVAPDMNPRECVTCTPLPSANNAAHSGFETKRRIHQKSKTGVSVAPQEGLMSSKNLVVSRKIVNVYFLSVLRSKSCVHRARSRNQI